jgi:hypothetical protein
MGRDQQGDKPYVLFLHPSGFLVDVRQPEMQLELHHAVC